MAACAAVSVFSASCADVADDGVSRSRNHPAIRCDFGTSVFIAEVLVANFTFPICSVSCCRTGSCNSSMRSEGVPRDVVFIFSPVGLICINTVDRDIYHSPVFIVVKRIFAVSGKRRGLDDNRG